MCTTISSRFSFVSLETNTIFPNISLHSFFPFYTFITLNTCNFQLRKLIGLFLGCLDIGIKFLSANWCKHVVLQFRQFFSKFKLLLRLTKWKVQKKLLVHSLCPFSPFGPTSPGFPFSPLSPCKPSFPFSPLSPLAPASPKRFEQGHVIIL